MTDRRQISYFSLTAGGALLALKLKERFGGEAHLPRSQSLGCGHCRSFDNLSGALPERFLAGDAIVGVMAAGIMFRVLAPLLKSKHEDPAVIVIDDEGRFVVPLLGGHAAGANALARELAAFLGAAAVLTTASDALGLIAPDDVAARLGAAVADPVALRQVTALLVDGKPVCIEAASDPGIQGYGWVAPGGSLKGYAGRLLVTRAAADTAAGTHDDTIPTARLIPRDVAAGVGCHTGTNASSVVRAIRETCVGAGIDPRAVAVIASVNGKEREQGLAAAADRLGAGLRFFAAEELAALGRPGSDFVENSVGTPAVSEPAALLAAGEGAELIAGKTAGKRITVALAAGSSPLSPFRGRAGEGVQAEPGARPGSVAAIGTGAGTAPRLTREAVAAIEAADVVVGYRTYTEQLRQLFPDKKYVAGSMGREIERCREALEQAAAGRNVALISSGDPGVYGMAGPLLEMADGIPVSVIPGVTAAQIAAARLGAPLMNDYVTLSLSDLLTPRDEVLRRAEVAAASDMVVCLYNPSSKKRRPLFEAACAIMLKHRPGGTPTGWVRDAGGPAEAGGIIRLAALPGQDIDMRTIVIVGNSRTRVVNGKMVTARGYEKKDSHPENSFIPEAAKDIG